MLSGAIVGFGNVAQFGHWPAYQENSEARIVAVVEEHAERRAVAEELGFRAFHRIAELREIDFVDICTPPATHAEQIIEAARNGWHVLCEKPLVISSAQLRQISGANVPIVPVHNWKYAPIIRRATDLVRNGAIGNLKRAEISVLRTQPAISTGRSWRGNPRFSGGGIVMDHGWHAIYLALDWFGEPARYVHADLVRSTAKNLTGLTGQVPAAFEAAAVENEARLELVFSAGSAQICLSWNGTTRENRIKLVGDGGEIAIHDDVLRVNGQTEHFAHKLSAGSHHPDWFAAMLPDVLAIFREPARARPLFDEAAECLRIIEQAYATS